MPRTPRSLQPDGFFHVTVRGNRQSAIFVDELDRHAFLHRVENVSERVPWSILDYCLMSNHAHLLVHGPVEQLSRGMHLLLGWYAQRFNIRHEISGHHFQGRFASEPIQRDPHLLEVVRYIALNPVRARLCRRPQDWDWSGYAALIGRRRPPGFMRRDEAQRLFAPRRTDAVDRIREFVEHGAGPASPPPS